MSKILDICSASETKTISYETVSYLDMKYDFDLKNMSSFFISGISGDVIRRIVNVYNRLITFTFYKTPNYNTKFGVKCIGTVNKNPVNIGGILFKANTAKLISFDSKKVCYANSDDSTTIYYATMVTIEQKIGKPVDRTYFPIEGVEFRHPVIGNFCRVQFASEPEKYLNGFYPNAVHIYNGYGYYSDALPELNVLVPVPLDMNGNMSFNKVYYSYTTDAHALDWGSIDFPKKGMEELVL